jgi:hypothetical protein
MSSFNPDEPEKKSVRRFNKFRQRDNAQGFRNLGIPVNILDLISEFKEEYNLDQEKIAQAADNGCEQSAEINAQLDDLKLLAMEGLIVQQNLKSLGHAEAEIEQQRRMLARNQQTVAENRELKRYIHDLVFTFTWTQVRRNLPYIGIALLGVIALLIFLNSKNGSHTPAPISPQVQSPTSPVQPRK